MRCSCILGLFAVALATAPGSSSASVRASAAPGVRASGRPFELLVAKKSNKKKKGAKAESAAAASKGGDSTVRIRTGDTKRATLKVGKKTHAVYVVVSQSPMTFEFSGDGKLGLGVYQAMPGKKGKKVTVSVE